MENFARMAIKKQSIRQEVKEIFEEAQNKISWAPQNLSVEDDPDAYKLANDQDD